MVIARKKKWPRQNLAELANFLEGFYPEGIALEDVARRLHTSPQSISNMFRRDDMKLSKAEQIAAAYGHTLKLYYPVRTYEDGYIPIKPTHTYPTAGNLTGLVKYILDSEYYFVFVAEKRDIHPTTLSKAFKKGDILISRLNQLLDTLGIYTEWKFEKNENK